jgi:putative phosphoesterase
MFVVLSDTHSREGHRLDGRALAAVEAADVLVHAGDFVAETALDAFQSLGPTLHAVHGNVDEPAVAERLPTARSLDLGGVRVALTHGHEHRGTTGLALFGRERDADLVVFGHSHVPGVERAGEVTLLNPGSHADPRGNPASHAELEPRDGGGLRGQLVERDGTVLEEFVVGD